MTCLRPSHFFIVSALLLAVFAGFDGLDPTPAKARKGYGGGGYGYKQCRTGCQIRKCKGTCRKAKRTCVYCVKKDFKPVLAACTGSDRKACRADAKAQIKTAIQSCGGLNSECGGCCKQNYAGSCITSFAGTSGFGSYFQGGYKPDCDGGGGSGNACQRACEKARAVALQSCKRGCDTASIEAAYQACLSGCGPGSARAAFVR